MKLVCKESFGDFLIAYLTSRLTTLGLDAENGLGHGLLMFSSPSPRATGMEGGEGI